jgi:hypothetical protein
VFFAYLHKMIVDRIVVGNSTIEQRIFFEARELDAGLYDVLVLVIFSLYFLPTCSSSCALDFIDTVDTVASPSFPSPLV